LHIEAVKPAIRVLMIDGIKSFVTGLSTATPVLRPEAVHEFTERIVNPRPPKKDAAPGIPAISEEKTQPPQNVSRARAIFDAAEEAKPFDPADFDFAMTEEDAAVDTISPSLEESSPATPLPRSTSQTKKILGMTRSQLIIIAALAIALLCILAIFAYFFFSSNPILP
jgi:hypothetical protein